MPFGLTNTPAVFERLIQKVQNGLNPDGGKQFVAAYLDDIVVFLETLQDHLMHLWQVIDRQKFANLKLKLAEVVVCEERSRILGTYYYSQWSQA